MKVKKVIDYFNKNGFSVEEDHCKNCFVGTGDYRGLCGHLYPSNRQLLLTLPSQVELDLEERLRKIQKDLKRGDKIEILIYDPRTSSAKQIEEYQFRK